MAERKPVVKRAKNQQPNSNSLYGAFRAIVSDVKDPLGQGRVRVLLPALLDSADSEIWARVATLMAGDNRGTWFVPDVNDEVLVIFEGGDLGFPFVIGSLWRGADKPPVSMDDEGNNNLKVIRSRSGLQVTLDDTSGRETLTLETPGGQRVKLTDTSGAIEMVDGIGNSVKLEPGGITVMAQTRVMVIAPTIEVSASTLTINAGVSKFSGVVQADTVICNSIISASYSPGAGNLF